jgi:hypothetical protein
MQPSASPVVEATWCAATAAEAAPMSSNGSGEEAVARAARILDEAFGRSGQTCLSAGYLKNVWLAPPASDFLTAVQSAPTYPVLGAMIVPGQDGAPRVPILINETASSAIFLVRISAHRSTVRPSFQSTHRHLRPEGLPSGRSSIIQLTALPPARRDGRFSALPR